MLTSTEEKPLVILRNDLHGLQSRIQEQIDTFCNFHGVSIDIDVKIHNLHGFNTIRNAFEDTNFKSSVLIKLKL